jgi:hypothetical protein
VSEGLLFAGVLAVVLAWFVLRGAWTQVKAGRVDVETAADASIVGVLFALVALILLSAGVVL